MDRNAQGRWAYEQPLAFDGERTRIPDFTIRTDDPERPIYWEHLGMLRDSRYATRWQEKRQWYARHGILPGPAGGPRGTLLATDDLNGVDEPAWEGAFTALYGASATIRPHTITRRLPRSR
jgi:hypothetical protein